MERIERPTMRLLPGGMAPKRLAIVSLGFLLLLHSREIAAQERTIVFTHATVIDGTGKAPIPDVTVTIDRGRITDLRPSTKARVPPGARVIEATNKYLIPGLWDMHVHWYDERFLPLFLANGVTGIRMMWGAPVHLKWRAAVANGTLRGPRMVVAGPLLDGPNPVWPDSTVVSSAAEGRNAVRAIKSDGYDFIKVYARLSREAYLAIADEAGRAGIPFAGHVPNVLTAAEASNAHQKSIEHLDGLLAGASSVEKEVRERAAALSTGGEAGAGISAASRAARREVSERVLATADPAKAARLFSRFVRNGTWNCPTLTVLHAFASLDDPAFVSDPRLKYMPRSIRKSWRPENDPRFATKTAKDYEIGRRMLRRQIELVEAMNRAGVRLIAGTDVGNPFAFPGFSLHDELALLVEAGLSPRQALRTATSGPAEFLGRTGDLGTIERGKIADLVLLDRNPLEDIHNTTAISAVVAGGRLYERTELDGMLAEAQRIANLQSIAQRLSETIEAKGIGPAVALYRDLKAREKDSYDFSEVELSALGYELMATKKSTEAIQIFELNVEANPDSADAYDSLADAYAEHGDRQLAIESYRKTLQLDGANTATALKLKKLEGMDAVR